MFLPLTFPRLAADERERPAYWTLAGLSLVMLMPSLDTSIANAGLPALAHAFGATFRQVQWIVLSYLLTITTMIVSAGRLGDLVGRRRMMLAAITVFTLASVMCGLASSLPMLLAARAAQGLGAAAMMALAIALVGDTVPAQGTGKAMGVLGSMSAIGTALGPSLGGVLMSAFGWPSIFLINVPVGIVAFALVRRHVAGDQPRDPAARRFDVAGTALLIVVLAAYALSTTLRSPWLGPFNAALVIAALLAATGFAVVESRTPFPLVQLATLRDRIIGRGLMMSAMVSTVMMTTLVVGPFYLSRVLGLSPMASGFALSVGPIVAAVIGIPAGRLVDRIGAPRMMIVGLIAIAAGALGLVLVPSRSGVAGYVAPIALMTSGYASFQAANNTAIMAGASPDHRGVIAGLVSLSRNLGLITGAAVMAAIFAKSVGTQDPMSAAPGQIAMGMRITFAAAAAVIGVALAFAPWRAAAPAKQ